MKAKEAKLKAEFVRFILRNKTIEDVIKETFEEMKMAWRDKKKEITKLMDPRHKDGIESFFKEKRFDVIDVTMKTNDEEAPRELLISWKRGIINNEI